MSTARTTKTDRRIAAVERACRYIEARIDGMEGDGASDDQGVVTLAELGAHCGMSPWHLQRLFTRAMGVSPRQYADARRLKRFKAGLQQGDGVAAATYDAGYGSSSRVYERADAALGMTPATYAKGGRGARIRYALTATPLGQLLVAATERGICFISLGARREELEQRLRREFPAAEGIEHSEPVLASAVRAIVGFIAGKEPHINLPLDIRWTAFQRRVWEELRRIPLGETRSYGEDRPRPRSTARPARGRTCLRRNPVPLACPATGSCAATAISVVIVSVQSESVGCWSARRRKSRGTKRKGGPLALPSAHSGDPINVRRSKPCLSELQRRRPRIYAFAGRRMACPSRLAGFCRPPIVGSSRSGPLCQQGTRPVRPPMGSM
jgi:AraC family transcriptional regulator of adaptative response/methylated-DNA-[protein]-cysteine methyltransferase